jgi:hypothetical protein
MWVLSLLSPVVVLLLAFVMVAWCRYHKSRARLVRLISRIPGPPSLPVIGNCIEINVDHDGTSLGSPRSVSAAVPLLSA